MSQGPIELLETERSLNLEGGKLSYDGRSGSSINNRNSWSGREGVKGRNVESRTSGPFLLLQLLVVKLCDLDDRRGDAERGPAPTGRGSHRLDFTPFT